MKMLMWCLGLHFILAPVISIIIRENHWYLMTWLSVMLILIAVFAEHMLNSE